MMATTLFGDLSERLSFSTTTDSNNNNSDNAIIDEFEHVKEDKYSLRPRSMRRRITEKAGSGAGVTKSDAEAVKSKAKKSPKQKPAPLSKYRRKTANARERNRMREINQAFETLRRVIPQMAVPQVQQPSPSNEKLTKITTLRLAMKYISTLSATLTGGGISGSNGSDYSLDGTTTSLSDYSDLECLLLESDGESLPLSDHSLLASPDFPEPSLSPVDFGDPSCLVPLVDFGEHSLMEHSDFSDFLLT